MAHREYGADAMKKLQAEARARRQAELAEKREAQRLKELAEYEAQKERRHRAWAARGNQFFERKIAEEKAMEEAAEFRRLEAIRVKKEQEAQKKRLAEAYAARMEAARLVAEAKERERKRKEKFGDLRPPPSPSTSTKKRSPSTLLRFVPTPTKMLLPPQKAPFTFAAADRAKGSVLACMLFFVFFSLPNVLRTALIRGG